MTVLPVRPLAERGSAHQLMEFTSAQGEEQERGAGHGHKPCSAARKQRMKRGQSNYARSNRERVAVAQEIGQARVHFYCKGEKRNQSRTFEEGSNIVAVGVKREHGERSLELGELTNGGEHFSTATESV